MAATFTWNERNGASPGSETAGVGNINWKAVDDTTTAYSNSNAVIAAGTNSYTKWQYGKFTGAYNTISNVLYIHQSGVFGAGVTLRCQKSMTQDSDRLSYITPSRVADNVNITPVDFTGVGTSVTVYVGDLEAGVDGAASSGKAAAANKPGVSGTLWTNYLVTQLQTTGLAAPGDTAPITIRLQYDES